MDLKAIAVAKDDYAGEIAKVLRPEESGWFYHANAVTQLMKLILLATILSPKANKYLGRMPSLSLPAQAAIRTIIQEVCNNLSREIVPC